MVSLAEGGIEEFDPGKVGGEEKKLAVGEGRVETGCNNINLQRERIASEQVPGNRAECPGRRFSLIPFLDVTGNRFFILSKGHKWGFLNAIKVLETDGWTTAAVVV